MASASGAASSSDDGSRCLLLALSHDELGVIFDGLADPLQPVVAVALSSTCEGLRTPLQAALQVLQERHERAVALCSKVGNGCNFFGNRPPDVRWRPITCAELLDAECLEWQRDLYHHPCLDDDDMATLGMIMGTNGLPRLGRLILACNGFENAGMRALCEGLGCGAAPSLRDLRLEANNVGPSGVQALAAALTRGAMPNLETLYLSNNPIGKQGMAALVAPLRKLPALRSLYFQSCDIGDEGVASLVDDLGKDDFKKLEKLSIQSNQLTDHAYARLAAVIDSNGMPSLVKVRGVAWNENVGPSDAAIQALDDALERAKARRFAESYAAATAAAAAAAAVS